MTPQRLSDFLPLAVQSLIQPRVGLRTILDIPAARVDIIRAAWLVIVLNLIFSKALTLFGPATLSETQSDVPLSSSVILLMITMFGSAFILHRVGNLFGGEGDFDSSLKTVVWLNFMLLLMQLPMPFFAVAGPEVAGLVILLVLLVAMTQIVAQTMELHGFTQVFPVILGILGVQFVFGMVLLILLSILGIQFPIEPTS